MPDLRLRVFYDGESADAGMLRTAAIADDSAAKMGASGAKAGDKFAKGIDSGTTKAGNAFSKLGSSLGNWGLPFSSNLEKIGKDLNNVETRGKGFGEAMSAVGGVTVAAFAGVAAESVHLADQFEKAQAGLKAAVTNSGVAWDSFSAKANAAYASAAKLGFENNDVAQALATLTTATNSPTKALSDLNVVENIARMRHETLADASAQLAKVLGGNTRILAQWGINLDIGSAKLHSIQSAEETLQKAQLGLNTVQAEINDGQEVGARAAGALASAKLAVRNASLNLQESQNAEADIMDALNQRTKNAATLYGQTFAGQLEIAKSEIHNVGVELGEALLPKINDLLNVGGNVLGFFQKNKTAAEALGGVIGGTLAAAVAVFTVNKLVALGKGIVGIAESFGSLADYSP